MIQKLDQVFKGVERGCFGLVNHNGERGLIIMIQCK